MRQETKQVGNQTYVKCYGPNFFRLEEEADGQKAYYHIYINNEDVECCPLEASRDEVDMRFHELLEQNGIEDDDMYVRKLI